MEIIVSHCGIIEYLKQRLLCCYYYLVVCGWDEEELSMTTIDAMPLMMMMSFCGPEIINLSLRKKSLWRF